MENNDEIIELWIDSIVHNKIKKIDIEKKFKYFNIFFLVISIILILVFIIQIKNWLFLLWEKIDLNNFTYKYSNYKEWWNIFWIFTYTFLHWGINHLVSNIIFFYILSLILSRIFKFLNSILLFLILWIIAWIPGYFLNDLPSLWASWAIFWIFWICTIFYFLNKEKLENNLHDLSWTLLFLALYEILLWFSSWMIDNYAHISWYIWWLIIWYILLKNKNITEL